VSWLLFLFHLSYLQHRQHVIPPSLHPEELSLGLSQGTQTDVLSYLWDIQLDIQHSPLLGHVALAWHCQGFSIEARVFGKPCHLSPV
jgi:hypothetical protein